MNSLRAGRVVAGKYRLQRVLAEGGMGAVWVARHVELDVEVAIKFMNAEAQEDESGDLRFKREAKAAARLRSPHVSHIHDYGIDDGVPYMAMELLDGEDLATVLERDGHVAPGHLAELVSQLARGLKVAHKAGLVHRDLKPANIFLARSGDEVVVKILDFGIAKEVSSEFVTGGKTSVGTLVGSPRYMSPEQARGGRLDHRSDLWSLAVVMFECLSGRPLFEGEHLGGIVAAIVGDELPRLSQISPALGDRFDAFFDQALDRTPECRFDSAEQLAAAFAALVEAASLQDLLEALPPSTAPAERPGARAVATIDALSGPPSVDDAPTLARPEDRVAESETSGEPPAIPAAAIEGSGTRRGLSASVDTAAREGGASGRGRVWMLAAVVGIVALVGMLTRERAGEQPAARGSATVRASPANTAVQAPAPVVNSEPSAARVAPAPAATSSAAPAPRPARRAPLPTRPPAKRAAPPEASAPAIPPAAPKSAPSAAPESTAVAPVPPTADPIFGIPLPDER